MNLKDYTEQAGRTDAMLGDNYPHLHAIHMLLGMSTEIAEIQDIYKKHLAYGKPIDEVNEKEEIGDLMWYIANHCNQKGWDLGEILDTNIKKLQHRYPEKFTKEKAINRDLLTERKILEEDTLSSTEVNELSKQE